MDLKQYFLEQLEREASSARKTVERVPEGRNTWKPHERSMELGYLAALVATMPGWPAFMIDREQLDLNDPSGATFRTKAVETRAELLNLSQRRTREVSYRPAEHDGRAPVATLAAEEGRPGAHPGSSLRDDRRWSVKPSRASSRPAHRLSPSV